MLVKLGVPGRDGDGGRALRTAEASAGNGFTGQSKKVLIMLDSIMYIDPTTATSIDRAVSLSNALAMKLETVQQMRKQRRARPITPTGTWTPDLSI